MSGSVNLRMIPRRMGSWSEKSSLRFIICEIRVVRTRAISRTSSLYLGEAGKYVGESGARIE